MKKLFLLSVAAAIVCACGVKGKVALLEREDFSRELITSPSDKTPDLKYESALRDTLKVRDDSGKEFTLMKTVREENGEMVASDFLEAAVVTARFKNVAERQGKIIIGFDINVPTALLDSKWQLRFLPQVYMGGEKTPLDAVYITGALYRKEQLRGYQRYEAFVRSIARDSVNFIYRRQLELFIKRNLPALYRYRLDSAKVSEADFVSAFGVSGKEALEHYTNRLAIRRNRRKLGRKEEVFAKFVKSPIIRQGIRLDSVFRGSDSIVTYSYSQEMTPGPNLKKLEVALSGEIMMDGEKIYGLPETQRLTYYISSLSSLLEQKTRYLDKVIERRAKVNTLCYIDFPSGSSEISLNLGHNGEEMGRVRKNLLELVENEKFDLDSVVISAYSSPEGDFEYNQNLSKRRAEAVSDFLKSYAGHCADSLNKECGVTYDERGNLIGNRYRGDFPVRSRWLGENWDMLRNLILRDSLIGSKEKNEALALWSVRDGDEREKRLSELPVYIRLREKAYPKLRVVNFEFCLHRKGMVKDTVHTTVKDSVYSEGLQALKDRDYKKALEILRPYQDYNTAVAYAALNYNARALNILERAESSDKSEYLLAILYSREGETEKAVSKYLSACAKNRSYVSRGNLDPEISSLIRAYGLNRDI